MQLAETSVWIDHLRRGEAVLEALLERNEVVIHPYVIGELAMGQFRSRREVFAGLERLPQIAIAGPDEVPQFVEEHALFGLGIGYVDAHFLHAAHAGRDLQLWTRDRRMESAAAALGLASVYT